MLVRILYAHLACTILVSRNRIIFNCKKEHARNLILFFGAVHFSNACRFSNSQSNILHYFRDFFNFD